MSTQITTVDKGKYLVFNHSPAELQAVLDANLGGTELTERNLPRVKLPTGGNTTWQIPGPFGVEASDELTGVLVFFKRTRAYWPTKKITGEPPACMSPDNIRGIGTPGGACRTCPMNSWGSDVGGGNGKACKEREVWFLLRDNGFLPLVLSLSPASLGAAEQYRIGLASGGVPLEAVQTTVALKSESGPEGPYAVAVPKFSGQLDPEERTRAAQYAASMRPLFEAAAASMATETDGPGSSGPMGTTADIDVDLDEPDKAGSLR
jgi:hypothetical protein